MADLNEKTTDTAEEVAVEKKADKKGDKKAPKEKKPNIFKRLFRYLRDCVSEL